MWTHQTRPNGSTYLQVQKADGLWCVGVQFGSFQSKARKELLQPVPQGRSLDQKGPLQPQPAQMLQVTTIQQDRAYRGGNKVITMQEYLKCQIICLYTEKLHFSTFIYNYYQLSRVNSTVLHFLTLVFGDQSTFNKD